MRAVYDRYDGRPGFETSFYFGLLARPMSAEGFDAATTYSGYYMTEELEQGMAEVDDHGTWRLTIRGREVALAVQQALGDWAEEFWDRKPIATMPGMVIVARLADLVGRLLEAGQATGGPAFRAMAPVYEPTDATPAVRLTSRLGALRHHRADAHRAAWSAAGLTLPQLLALTPEDPQRQAIEGDQPPGRAHLPGPVGSRTRRVARRRTIVPVMDETPRTYSISVRLQRTTTEETYLSVPLNDAIMQDEAAADGSYRIDTAKLWTEAIRLAEQSADWAIENRQVSPHPIQQAPPWVADQHSEEPSGGQN